MTYDLRITQLRYTAAQFKASNPVPLSGQLCLETDSGVSKTGDGATAYLSLPLTTLSGDERRSAQDVWDASNAPTIVGVSLDGVAQSGIASFTGTTDENGEVVIDLTAEIAGIQSAYMIACVTTATDSLVTGVSSSTLSAFTVIVTGADDLLPEASVDVITTIAYKL